MHRCRFIVAADTSSGSRPITLRYSCCPAVILSHNGAFLTMSIHALRLLRCHGLNDAALQTAYRTIIVTRLTYATSAWWGFTTSDDHWCIEGLLRRGIRAGFYRTGWSTVENFVEDALMMIFSDMSYIMKIVFYIPCCPNKTMDTHCNADAVNELSRRTMTNAILCTGINIHVNIATNFSTRPLSIV